MSDRTRTTSMVRLLLAAALFAVIASVVIVPGWAAAVGNPGVAGSWQITITDASGQTQPGLATFDADGTMVISDLPVTSLGSNAFGYVSSGHGVWTAKSGTDISFTFMELVSDRQGQLAATFTIDAQGVVDSSGDKFDGTYVATATAPDGTSMGTFGGTFAATRMTVQPMPSLPAAASPAASGSPAA